ncbi:hypothetical protein [Agathobaculum sp.]|nr:hypothetical protein [Agathobaculum sp.]MDY3618995.1 hypothetical protein [Agathobaculum sp.]
MEYLAICLKKTKNVEKKKLIFGLAMKKEILIRKRKGETGFSVKKRDF